MKLLVTIARILVGILFIFSGLIKANDPIGLSYKMQEFFELWSMSALNGITLTLSVLMIAFEIIAGVALLLGWQRKLIQWLLLLLILFFTFLTGYAYLSGKFTNCGCFGDCIPITSKTSFIKDLVLLVLILFLFFNQRFIRPVFSKKATGILMLLATVLSFGFQWYTLKYLPVLDCLPFKKGSFIPDKLKIPANAIPDSTEITFVYEKEGKQVEFNSDHFPDDFNDSTYKFINRYDKILKEGSNNIPEIRGFDFINGMGTNVTQALLDADHILLLFAEDLSRPVADWKAGFEPVYAAARQRQWPVYVISSMAHPVKQAIAGTAFKDVEVLGGDRVMIRMAARTNPTLYLLKKGTVAGKWSYKQFGTANKVLSAFPAVAPQVQQDTATADPDHLK
ncbi:BT_3928 family protein [Niabella beijingensis]|uniref:BT_3928 family protein n=1 Tax=Niabella beijingensis TaxID=2872700 RepID=UPI001CBC7FA2|nr:BT_3928 family protein [Niabella beijingensis]MBZ4191250.1 DoxX family protein [Niabella beijingensis]